MHANGLNSNAEVVFVLTTKLKQITVGTIKPVIKAVRITAKN